MKQTKYIFIFVALILTMMGCTTNNGDIGVYYGEWALKSITIDGVEDTSWCNDGTWTTWSFQNNVICITRTNDLLDCDICWGTWSDNNGTLSIDYRHYDDTYTIGTGEYNAPTWIYFEKKSITVFNIDSQSSKAMTLSTTDNLGRKLTYTLRKTY
jgi:hypothetical protein